MNPQKMTVGEMLDEIDRILQIDGAYQTDEETLDAIAALLDAWRAAAE